MTGVAICDSRTTQSGIRNMRRRSTVCRWVSAIVTSGAGIRYWHLRVVPLTRNPAGGVVAGNAVGGANTYVRGFLPTRSSSVMTGSAVGGGCKRTVIHSRTNPRGRGFMARLAIAGNAVVNRSSGFSG
jgi:hypothetical protein